MRNRAAVLPCQELLPSATETLAARLPVYPAELVEVLPVEASRVMWTALIPTAVGSRTRLARKLRLLAISSVREDGVVIAYRGLELRRRERARSISLAICVRRSGLRSSFSCSVNASRDRGLFLLVRILAVIYIRGKLVDA
jgi:hypothetical protein